MTDPGYVHDIFIIDRSGSMDDILAGMQSGFQELVKEQEASLLRTTASLWQFDNIIENLHSFQPIGALHDYQLIPRNSTAMFDAIADAVIAEGEKLAAMPENERPGQVNVLVVSDGLNNASTRYTGPQVAGILRHQQEAYGWGVLYMGCNQDALKEGAAVGVATASSLSFDSSNTGAHVAYAASSSALRRQSESLLRGESATLSYTDEERRQANPE